MHLREGIGGKCYGRDFSFLKEKSKKEDDGVHSPHQCLSFSRSHLAIPFMLTTVRDFIWHRTPTKVMVVRGTDGNVVPYPVVEFTARDNICRTTMCPAQVSAELRAAATKVASEAVACLPGVGIFGVELFAMSDGTVFLNEVAPRPHNSGHFTIEACGCSQFEAHVRAVAGLPLPKDTSLRVGASLMLNILGDDSGSMAETKEELNRLSDVAGSAPHWYGKDASRKGRKMAHVTFCAASVAALRANLEVVSDILGEAAMPVSTPVVGYE